MSKRLFDKAKPKFFVSKYDKNKHRQLSANIEKSIKSKLIKNTNFNEENSFRYGNKKSLISTQEINIDYNHFENHTFFNSAVAKTNEAFHKIINFYPFDGSLKEVENFEDSLTGFESYVLDRFPKNTGYLIFSGTQTGESLSNGTQINVKDVEGVSNTSIAKKSSGLSRLNPLNKSFTFQFFLNPATKANGNQILVQKKFSLSNHMTVGLTQDTSVQECSVFFTISSVLTFLIALYTG